MKSIFKHLSTADLISAKIVERYTSLLKDDEEEVVCSCFPVLPWVLEKSSPDLISKIV